MGYNDYWEIHLIMVGPQQIATQAQENKAVVFPSDIEKYK